MATPELLSVRLSQIVEDGRAVIEKLRAYDPVTVGAAHALDAWQNAALSALADAPPYLFAWFRARVMSGLDVAGGPSANYTQQAEERVAFLQLAADACRLDEPDPPAGKAVIATAARARMLDLHWQAERLRDVLLNVGEEDDVSELVERLRAWDADVERLADLLPEEQAGFVLQADEDRAVALPAAPGVPPDLVERLEDRHWCLHKLAFELPDGDWGMKASAKLANLRG